ncbi:extracellular calcium-sensing receptor isoform X1 [Hydra vulgaris]|uniref:Extracellular calcium-sensing receptor isoform X1 n=2 Tax=Hydra vulgaris TaxID=6087 RepID=A0ABM4BLM7_HYDVU
MCRNYNIIFSLLLLITKSSADWDWIGCYNESKELYDTENTTVIIGGIFPIHFWDQENKKYVLNKPGLLWVEAMIFAINEINHSSSFLQKTKVGYRIHDSCNDIKKAMKSALELTQGFPPDGKCPCNSSISKVVAVVGDAASATSAKVAAILSSTVTTQISYSATSTDFNAKQAYPSFLRTIPPDNMQALLIVDLIIHNKWTYVSLIACDDEYGRVGFSELLQILKEVEVCIAVQEIYDVKSDVSDLLTIKVIEKIIQEENANVIVLWCQRPEAIRVLKKAESLRLHNKTWIATETYGMSENIYDIDPNVVRGMFGIVPSQVLYEPFETMLKSITPNTVNRNPWIQEYWREKSCDKGSTINCSSINLSELPKSKYAEVIHAVKSIIIGIQSYQKLNNTEPIKPKLLFPYVKNVSFTGLNNLTVSYDEQGNPVVASYSITNLKQIKNRKLKWQVIGSWNDKSRGIVLTSDSEIDYAGGSLKAPVSSCKEICKPGFFAFSFQSSCCWKCVKCANDSIQPKYGKSNCTPCTENKRSNINRTVCIQPENLYMKANSKEGVLLITFSTIGFIFVLLAIWTFYKYKDTFVVKASNRNLTLLQLVSILFILLLPLVYIHKETEVYKCGGQLFYFVCFNSIAISVNFTKADRLLRIFKKSKSGRLTKCSILKTNKVQFLTVAALTFIGIVLSLVSFFSFPVQVSYTQKTLENDKILVVYYCGGYYDSILFLMIGYVSLIALVCGVYAFKARNIPEIYNEARLTSLAMFVFLLSWLIFIPLYLSANGEQQKPEILCFVSFISVICFFLIMYAPKLYIVFFKAKENTRGRFKVKIAEFTKISNEFDRL